MLRDGRPPRGVVFDLDGTLTDNMALHAQAFERFCARHGLPPLTLERRARYDGKRNRDIFPDLLGRELGPDELRALVDEKESLYRELSAGRLVPLRGLLELLACLRRRAVPVAVATSSPARNVEHTLRELGLARELRDVLRSDEVPHGKPAPDVYLAAAERLGLPPGDCLAFEDAPLGVAAALSAGLTCVAVTTSFDEPGFAAHGPAPDACVPDYAAWLERFGAWLA